MVNLDKLAIEIDELKHHEFNAGWSEFKYLVLNYIKSQFGEDSEIGKLLLDDIENLC
jgi:hypothetical protein